MATAAPPPKRRRRSEVQAHALSGVVAGVVSRTATAPFDRLRTLMQAGLGYPLRPPSVSTLGISSSESPYAAFVPEPKHQLGPRDGKGPGFFGFGGSQDRLLRRPLSTPQPPAEPRDGRGPRCSETLRPKGSGQGMRRAATYVYDEGGLRGFFRGNGMNCLKIA